MSRSDMSLTRRIPIKYPKVINDPFLNSTIQKQKIINLTDGTILSGGYTFNKLYLNTDIIKFNISAYAQKFLRLNYSYPDPG